MSLTARPEVISLAGGLPATDLFPPHLFEEINAHIAAANRALGLQYGPTEGFDIVKQDIAVVMAHEWTMVDPERIIVTTGGQQAIDLVTKSFVDPGDVVLAESPAYAGALTTFWSYQAQVVHTPMDGDGVIPEALAKGEPVLLNFLVYEAEKVWPMVPAGAGVDEMIIGDQEPDAFETHAEREEVPA